MFTLTAGHQRTAEQLQVLLREARFELLRMISTARGNTVIEAAPR